MNTSAQTVITQATQQVAIHTLASDASSIEHGATIPAPEIMTIQDAPIEDVSHADGPKHGGMKLTLVFLVLLAIILLGYQYGYSYISEWFKPSVL